MKRFLVFLLLLTTAFFFLSCEDGSSDKDDDSKYIDEDDYPEFNIPGLDDGDSTTSRTHTVSTQVPNPGAEAGLSRAAGDTYTGEVRVYVNEAFALANPVYNATTGVWTIESSISINAGKNTIYVAVYTAEGDIYSESPRFEVDGDFEEHPFRVQLYWDDVSDVDLYVVYENNWTATDMCYFGTDSIDGGNVELDYDNTDALGPENITILEGARTGTYYVYVKLFWGDDTAEYPVTATVNLFEDGELADTMTHDFISTDDSNSSDVYNEATDWFVTSFVKSE